MYVFNPLLIHHVWSWFGFDFFPSWNQYQNLKLNFKQDEDQDLCWNKISNEDKLKTVFWFENSVKNKTNTWS